MSVVHINDRRTPPPKLDAETYDDPATRADLYFAEAERYTRAAREALDQITDEAERVKAQTGFLRIANVALGEVTE